MPDTSSGNPDYLPKDLSREFNIANANQLLDQAGAKHSGGTWTLTGRAMSWLYQTSVNEVL